MSQPYTFLIIKYNEILYEWLNQIFSFYNTLRVWYRYGHFCPGKQRRLIVNQSVQDTQSSIQSKSSEHKTAEGREEIRPETYLLSGSSKIRCLTVTERGQVTQMNPLKSDRAFRKSERGHPSYANSKS